MIVKVQSSIIRLTQTIKHNVDTLQKNTMEQIGPTGSSFLVRATEWELFWRLSLLLVSNLLPGDMHVVRVDLSPVDWSALCATAVQRCLQQDMRVGQLGGTALGIVQVDGGPVANHVSSHFHLHLSRKALDLETMQLANWKETIRNYSLQKSE